METQTIQTTETKFEIKVNGEQLVVDFAKMHPTWVAHYLQKAAQRRLNDDMSGLSPAEKLVETRKALAAIHAGEEYVPARRSGGGGVAKDPIKALALKNAKAALSLVFKNATKENKVADWAKHEKISPFFKETANGFTWDDSTVEKFMTAQKEKGAHDYMAEAKATLAVSEIDDALGDLF